MQLFLNRRSMMQFELDTEKIFLLLHKYDVITNGLVLPDNLK